MKRAPMKRWRATGIVAGGKYLGDFAAPTAEAASILALESADVSLCHQCSGECEDPVIERVVVDAIDGDESYDSDPPEDARARAIRAVVAAQWAVACIAWQWAEDERADNRNGHYRAEAVEEAIAALPTPEQIVDGAT